MKQQIISISLALMLTNNVNAITEVSPEKAISLDMDDSQARQPSSQLAPSSRGELLYLNHCRECHESNIHIREKHHASNINEIRAEVYRWATQLELKWSPRDIEDVVNHLNNRYYHYSE